MKSGTSDITQRDVVQILTQTNSYAHTRTNTHARHTEAHTQIHTLVQTDAYMQIGVVWCDYREIGMVAYGKIIKYFTFFSVFFCIPFLVFHVLYTHHLLFFFFRLLLSVCFSRVFFRIFLTQILHN